MPVPKRKTSKSRRDMRQSTKFIRPQAITSCTECNEPNLPHQICVSCGFYKGRKVVTTKNDRGVARMETRAASAKKAEARKAAAGSDDHAGHDHDGHDHSDHA